MLIAIEGMDASGKATHAKLLARELDGIVIDFPHYSTPTGKLILGHLKKWWETRRDPLVDEFKSTEHAGLELLDPMVFQCLQTVNRLELLPEILKHDNKQQTVIFDRYWASAVVYGTLDGLDEEWIRRIQAPLPDPDLWFFLDIPASESIRRRPERRDRYEQQPGLMPKVRDRYRALFEGEAAKEENQGVGKSWFIIDGMGTKEEVHERILDIVKRETGWTPKAT